MKKLLSIFLLPVLLLGCGPSAKEKSISSEVIEKSQNISDKVDNNQRKIIKEGSLRFRTGDIEQTNNFIHSIIKKFGAYISKEEKFNYNNKVGYDLTIRVPSDKFDSLIILILQNRFIKDLDSKNTQLQDVTEEFIDIQSRLKIKKESAQKLLDLLKQAKNVTETLEINKQLTELQSDIESIEGRLKYLNDQVSFSTINVAFYENIKYSKRFLKDFWDGLKNGWQIFLYVITLLSYLWVIILVTLLIIWGLRYYRKKTRERRNNNAA